MATISIAFGVVFLLLGIVGYAATGAQSPTALIPAALGAVLVVLGLVARNASRRKHAMHGAAVAALVGLLGSMRGIVGVFQMMGGEPVARPAAAVAQSIMAVLCLAFLGLAVRSFVAARTARRAG